MLARRFLVSPIFLLLAVLVAAIPANAQEQSRPEILPTGMSITPFAAPGHDFSVLESEAPFPARLPRRHGGDFGTQPG
jgi:hypothetical protein